jgi:hypothetical protein
MRLEKPRPHYTAGTLLKGAEHRPKEQGRIRRLKFPALRRKIFKFSKFPKIGSVVKN